MVKGIFITGTDTDVGKTQVTSGLAGALQLRAAETGDAAVRLPIHLWKPVQSGAMPGTPGADSYRLLHGSGLAAVEADIASVSLELPLAPWMAARRAGTAVNFAALVGEGRKRLAQPGFTLVEGAGGLLVPLAEDAMIADLAAALGLPLLIVGRAGLGTVNHTLLTVEAAERRGVPVLGVVLNMCMDVQGEALQENAMMIERFGGVPVLGLLPWRELMPIGSEGWFDSRDAWIRDVFYGMRWERLAERLRYFSKDNEFEMDTIGG